MQRTDKMFNVRSNVLNESYSRKINYVNGRQKDKLFSQINNVQTFSRNARLWRTLDLF